MFLSYHPKNTWVLLDSKLLFDEHLKMVSLKISKNLGLLQKLHNLLPKSALITIYKAFVRPYLDYGNILYDQVYNMSFHHKLESIQCNACLAITGAIRGTSMENLYQELGLEPLQLRRWYRKQIIFYQIYKNKSPQYLFKLIPKKPMHMLQETLKTFPVLKPDTTSSRTLSFLLQSLNGTI